MTVGLCKVISCIFLWEYSSLYDFRDDDDDDDKITQRTAREINTSETTVKTRLFPRAYTKYHRVETADGPQLTTETARTCVT